MKNNKAKEVFENIGGALLILFHLLVPFLRKSRDTWGATPEESSTVLPGDDLISSPNSSITHAITINSNPQGIWPWLMQIGQDRGGFYSYEMLENLAGCKMKNIYEIKPALQNPENHNGIKMHPMIPALPLHSYSMNEWLCFYGDGSKSETNTKEMPSTSWLFYLKPVNESQTRLIIRYRNKYGNSFLEKFANSPYILGPISFVMEQKLMKEIKTLAENN